MARQQGEVGPIHRPYDTTPCGDVPGGLRRQRRPESGAEAEEGAAGYLQRRGQRSVQCVLLYQGKSARPSAGAEIPPSPWPGTLSVIPEYCGT